MRARTLLLLLGASAIQLTAAQPQPSYDDMFPAWSPDGTHIVFTSTRDGDPEIYVMMADGTQPRRLTTTPGRDAHPFWSPDGKRIVFQSPRDDGQTRLFLMNADGSNQRPLTKNQGFCGAATWSPDGRHIAYQCSENYEPPNEKPWNLFVIDADTGAEQRLTRGAANDQVANWSADGRRLVFYSDRSGSDQLYVMDFPAGQPRPLTKPPGANKGASWSRDGQHLVFMSNRHGGAFDVYRMKIGEQVAIRLTTSGPDHGVPLFSPDGTKILFQDRSGGSWRIRIMDPDGGRARDLSRRPGDR